MEFIEHFWKVKSRKDESQMPNVWTHIIFGEKVANEVGYDISEDVKPYFRLGAQGPDPFFYHNFWPWKKKPVTEIGEKIHYEQCGSFLMKMIDYAREHPNDKKLQAYIIGFLTHHILDRNTHPYIIYRSGNEGNKHQKLEIIIDTLLMKQLHEVDTWKTPVYKEIFIGKKLYEPIGDMLSHLIDSFFPKTAGKMPNNYIEQAYRDMINALKILYDPNGWKNKFLKEHISPFSYQKQVDDRDYLNLEGTTWLHPTIETEQYNQTFFQLLDQAEDEGMTILTTTQKYWNHGDKNTYQSLKEKLGNLSYDTGKDCTLSLINLHFEPIL